MPNHLKNPPLLSIITVTYFSENQVLNLVNSVSSLCKTISYEHIIVDNGSKDLTLSLLKSLEGVDVISFNENKGFAAANLAGYKKAKGNFILFLNPDMQFVDDENIETLLSWAMQNKDVGIVGCKLLNNEGKLNKEALPRRFPRLSDQFAILLKLDKLFPKILDRYLYTCVDFNKEQIVDSVRGSFMLMTREFIETIGWPFDLRYFIWFEDVDICKEAWKNGYKVVHTPLIACIDGIGQSFKQQNRSWRFRQYASSLFIYLKKWEPINIWLIALLFFMPLSYLISLRMVGKLSKIFKT